MFRRIEPKDLLFENFFRIMKSIMKTRTYLFFFTSALLFQGCHVSSFTALEGNGGRASYNKAIQMTNSEQMLMNLVRLRYFDNPYFLNVGTVTTQFTYKNSVSPKIPIPGFNQSNPFSLGGEISWQNQPTIQYTPLEGKAFAEQILHPVDLQVLQQLIMSGWDIARVFRLAVQSFDHFLNAPEASGPVPDYEPRYKKFFAVTEILRYFQKRSELRIGIKKIQAKESGKELDVMQLVVPAEGEKAQQLRSLATSSKQVGDRLVLQFALGYNQKGNVGIMPRSILSCMYYLSNGIHVPPEDVAKGKVIVTKGQNKKVFNWSKMLGNLLKIYCCKQRPVDAYVCIHYRDQWFFIDDGDIHSKKTFLLLLQLYSLQAQDPRTKPPVLTLPIGG